MDKKARNLFKKNRGILFIWIVSYFFVFWLALIFVWQKGVYEWFYGLGAIVVSVLMGEALASRNPKAYGVPRRRRITFGMFGFMLVFMFWFVDFMMFENPEFLFQFMGGG